MPCWSNLTNFMLIRATNRTSKLNFAYCTLSAFKLFTRWCWAACFTSFYWSNKLYSNCRYHNNNKNIQVGWTLLNNKKNVFGKCFIEIQYFSSKVIALTATLFLCFFFPSSNICLLSSIILFIVKPKKVFLLKCSVNAIQHMLKKHKNLFLKHDIPSLMKFQNYMVYLELLFKVEIRCLVTCSCMIFKNLNVQLHFLNEKFLFPIFFSPS